MTDRPRTRQELYDRIRETSKDEFILEEMVRLGFWPARGEIPRDPADEIRRRGEVEREIAALHTEQARLHNVDALRKELRKRRLAESRKKQQETKERRERERIERAKAWAERKQHEILYLGAGVSGGLRKGAAGDVNKLKKFGLPEIATAEQLAQALQIPVGRLRFLAYARKTARVTHYVRFTIPKKSGGTRLISAPLPRLKRVQRWILDNILARLPIEDCAHGFVTKRSIVTNATAHMKPAVLVNLDLKDFFPTVTYPRVKGMFQGLGYSEEAATILALLTTEPDVDEVELDGVTHFVARGERHLPQGSPASPAITNVLCRRMDKRLRGMARMLGFAYTRYADDLTFSSPSKDADVGRLLRRVRFVLRQEGFTEHEGKTRVLRRGRRQEVTGIVVNTKPSVPRDVLRRFRALLFQLEKDGPQGKRWAGRENERTLPAAVGFAAYVTMVDPARGKPLLQQARRIARKHGWKPTPRGGAVKPVTPPSPPSSSPTPPPPAPVADQPGAPQPTPAPAKKKWWQIF